MRSPPAPTAHYESVIADYSAELAVAKLDLDQAAEALRTKQQKVLELERVVASTTSHGRNGCCCSATKATEHAPRTPR